MSHSQPQRQILPAERNLNAGFHERTVGSRVEFDQWREAHPDFTSAELLENWRQIRVAWGLCQADGRRVRR